MIDDLGVGNLLFAARGRIDVYWNFYVAVVLAVIGWLLSLKKTLRPSMKILVSVVFVIASLANLVGLYSAYTLAEALRVDLLRIAPATPLPATRALLEQFSYLAHRTAAVWIHAAIGISVLYVIWFVRISSTGDSPDS